MSRPRGPLAALVLLLPASAAAQTPASSEWRPALFVLGTSERGSGSAYAPPRDDLRRDDAASLAFALDARRLWPGGRLEASGFALAHDPLSSADRGFYLAGRVRGSFSWGARSWVLRFEDSPRLQRRETLGLSDFQRNEVWLQLEQQRSGPRLGFRIGDRRRSLPNDRLQGFERQSLTASVSGDLSGRGSWRLEAGPQHYSTEVAKGWRVATSAELAGILRRVSTALRLTWIEPWGGLSAGGRLASGAAPAAPQPSATPQPLPSPEPIEPPPVVEVAPQPTAPDAYLRFALPPPGLLGPSLVVDPLDSDEGDWDFGRRKQELVAVASRRLGDSLALSVELRGYRERGPDLTTSERGPVRRDRIALRVSLRRELGRRVALLAQGGWQQVRDNRPGFGFSRGIVCVGLELRP